MIKRKKKRWLNFDVTCLYTAKINHPENSTERIGTFLETRWPSNPAGSEAQCNLWRNLNWFRCPWYKDVYLMQFRQCLHRCRNWGKHSWPNATSVCFPALTIKLSSNSSVIIGRLDRNLSMYQLKRYYYIGIFQPLFKYNDLTLNPTVSEEVIL